MSGPGAGTRPSPQGTGPVSINALVAIFRVVLALVLGTAGVVRARSVFTFDPEPGSSAPFSDTNSGWTPTFNSVVFSPLATDFAIDNVDVAVRTTPEPASMALLGLGLTFLGVSARRRRQGKAAAIDPSYTGSRGEILVSGRRSVGL